jgi:hypothetical protein
MELGRVDRKARGSKAHTLTGKCKSLTGETRERELRTEREDRRDVPTDRGRYTCRKRECVKA